MASNNQTHYSTTGTSFTTLLTLVFITLKLIGIITWSWVWVLSPIWISFALLIAIIIVLSIVYVVKK